jgi:hypothetical protein
VNGTRRVADAIRPCWGEYNRVHALPPHVAGAVRHILECRTSALGGHIHRCDQCGGEVPVYNSCQDRNCPTCQTSAKEKWLSARRAELLPVQYFHCVFTVPHELNELISVNRRVLFGELFGTVNWVLQRFARDPQWRLEGQLGFIALLHTWSQRLHRHFHIHCLVPGGVWRAETAEWIACRNRWLFRKSSLADAFRNRFIRRLESLRRRGKLTYRRRAAPLADDGAWGELLARLRSVGWVVYPKAVPATPLKALEYISRYTHKVAISDHRILSVEAERVTFSWRDRADDNTVKEMTLPLAEFTRCFLNHILPRGFHKVRYYGWMAAARRKQLLPAIRAALGAKEPPDEEPQDLAERILERTGVDIYLCPLCGKGHLKQSNQRIARVRAPP